MSTRNQSQSAVARVVNDPVSRRKFMLLTGGSSAAVLGLAACGDDDDETTTPSTTTTAEAESQFGEGDLGIVNYALTLEYLEATFYDEVAKSGLFSGADQALIEEFGAQEQEHVDALKAVAAKLGEPASAPKTKFDLKDAQTVLSTAAAVENLGAAAYLGAAPMIESKEILASALAIHAVEARHAATLATILGEPITPDGPFAKPADEAMVLDEVQPFLVS